MSKVGPHLEPTESVAALEEYVEATDSSLIERFPRLAQHHGVTQNAVKDAAAKVGNSRTKVERELKAGKGGA